VPVDVLRAEKLLRAAAEGGWTSALGELERYWYAEGERAMHAADSDPARAVAGYRKAAELGHRRAALMLAECLRYGVGGPADLAQALRWYHKAAALFDAKVALGDMYFYGWGVDRNAREALRWYEQAVTQQEDAYAMYSLGYCMLHGQGTERDVGAGVGWLERAARLGEVDAQYELGGAYLRGVGSEDDGQRALEWLASAATLGHVQAQAFLERIEKPGPLN
jgi:TPR repeat protein